VNITVSAYNRPEYLRQTLAALRACDGLDSCLVAVLIDPSDEAGKMLRQRWASSRSPTPRESDATPPSGTPSSTGSR
jgi:hypothetical protein